MIYLGGSEQLKWCHPQPSMMPYPNAKSLAHFKRWARGGCRPIPFKDLSIGEIDGASVGPPPRD